MPLIYKHTCTITNYSYIGFTTKTMEQRFREHKSSAARGSKSLFHLALNKYGPESFTSEVLEEGDHVTMDEHEIKWIEYYGTYEDGYNMTKGGSVWTEHPMLGGEHNHTSKTKMSEVAKARKSNPYLHLEKFYQDPINQAKVKKILQDIAAQPDTLYANSMRSLGKTISPEQKKAISEANKGSKSTEHKLNMSKAQKAIMANKEVWEQNGALRVRHVWALANEFWHLSKFNPNNGGNGIGVGKAAKELNTQPTNKSCNDRTFMTMVDMFKEGWIPMNDHKWCNAFDVDARIITNPQTVKELIAGQRILSDTSHRSKPAHPPFAGSNSSFADIINSLGINYVVDNGVYEFHDRLKAIRVCSLDDNHMNNKVELLNQYEDRGYHLIQLWEDEVTDVSKTTSKLRHMLGLSGTKHYARKCHVVASSLKAVQGLLERVHIQGTTPRATATYSLMSGKEIVAAMVFTKRTESEYELARFASDSCVGAFGKLLKEFRKEYPNVTIVSFGDRMLVI
ncbi:hypothetical protein GR28A_00122 [Vibrio phage vB_VcorM_GR28A]|nr:hypothetical protein GR28A_00122 [Vibrio phage vB_VcorM_GR28A]